MKFIEPLYKKAKLTLKIMKDRFYGDDSNFLADEEGDLSQPTPMYSAASEENFFTSLRATYEDIAESDPEAALLMIKQELSDNPPKPILEALYDIERHIRLKYGGQYFRGIRAESGQ